MKLQKQKNVQPRSIFTAEEDLLAFSEEEMQNSSPTHPLTPHFIAGWPQSSSNAHPPFFS
jgi:hypothetical protein